MSNSLKIGIYSPYLDTASGGEKYILTIAETLSQKYSVDVFLDQHLMTFGADNLKQENSKKHGLDLSKVNFVAGPFGKGSSFFSRYFFLKKYNYFFLNSDGSVFYSTAKNSILHFQLPLDNPNKNMWQKIKLNSWREAIFNSKFTENYIQKNWGVKGEVIYPPVDIEKFKPLKKTNKIISVGRFDASLKTKKHEFMIETFKQMVNEKKVSGWSLYLAGGVMEGHEAYFNELKSSGAGYQIFFYDNISLSDLVRLYGESKIYWHAMGYGEDDPKRQEHFGISTVEAMAAGCVPVVIKRGGQVEIVENGVSGILWETPDQLIEETVLLIKDEKKLKELGEKAKERSKIFSKKHFEEKIESLIK